MSLVFRQINDINLNLLFGKKQGGVGPIFCEGTAACINHTANLPTVIGFDLFFCIGTTARIMKRFSSSPLLSFQVIYQSYRREKMYHY